MNSERFIFFTKYYQDDQIKGMIGQAYSKQGQQEKCIQHSHAEIPWKKKATWNRQM